MSVQHIHYFDSEIGVIKGDGSVRIQCDCGEVKSFGADEDEETPAAPPVVIQ